MQRILIIEDDAAVADILKEAIEDALKDVVCSVETRFENALNRLSLDRPDAIILDLREGAIDSNLPGQAAWQTIWSGRFCPLVIYTGGTGDLDPPLPDGHPFIKLVVKGNHTEHTVVDHLRSFVPMISTINTLQNEIDLVVQRVLRDTVAELLPSSSNGYVYIHAARRRVAALMDTQTEGENRTLYSWEQYLIPALGAHPMMGDILRHKGADRENAEAYRLVLTPSCDLVSGRERDTVLLARCTGPLATMKALGLTGTSQRVVDAIEKQALTRGFCSGIIPLPRFPQLIPLLSACLKDLEVVPYDHIGAAGQENVVFERIASIDSPFREQIAWAFMNTAARPGMPERDFQRWAQEIAEQSAEAQQAAKTQ